MIVGKSLDNIGGNFVVTYMTPLRGLQLITNLIEDATGETVNRFFKREFRFAMDGVKYGDWFDLSLSNLQNKIHPSGVLPFKNDLVIEFRYTREGDDDTGTLVLDNLTVAGLFSMQYLQVCDFEDTIFEDIGWTDEYFNKVWLNLMNKLYRFGIIPSFIQRGDDSEFDDDDFIAFFKTEAYFNSLLISLMDKLITHLSDDEILLSSFLRERSVLLSGVEPLDNLKLLSSGIFDQVRRRGTPDIFYQDGDWLDNITPHPRHGELLRYIGFDIVKDEFLYEYVRGGVFVNVNSFTYFGLTGHTQLNKTLENTQDFVDLNNFVVPDVGPVIIIDNGNKVCEIPPETKIETKEMKVSEWLSYEITFLFKVTQSLNSNPHGLTLRARLYDGSGFQLPLESIQLPNPLASDLLTDYVPASSEDYYHFRGIIYSTTVQSNDTSDLVLDLGAGSHLRMTPSAKRLVIEIENGGSADTGSYLRIWDFKCVPLNNFLTESSINGIDYTRIWLKNRNLSVPDADLEARIKDQEIPLGSGLLITFLK